MADFTSNFQTFKPSSSSSSSSFPFLDNNIDSNMELLNQFSILNQNMNLNLPQAQSFMGFPEENFFFSQQQILQNFPPVFHHHEEDIKNVVAVSNLPVLPDNGKRKAMDVTTASSSGNYSSPPVSENGIDQANYHSSGKGKKVKVSEKGDEMPKEVVHVRARRGQATDSHSLAERVRRRKINERMRCLQDIVPGCYKTMGMAVMLDEIINYVQSLQNQVEFLSMKLTEASRFHDFDTDSGSIEALLEGKAMEAEKMQRVEEERGGGGYTEIIGPIDHSFGTFPSLPYHTT